MGHQPFETWMLSEENLLPEQEQRLQEHIMGCESCRQMSNAWQEVQEVITATPLVEPAAGFTERWQVRFNEMNLVEFAHRQRRVSWLFFGLMTGAALLIFSYLVIQFFSSVQAPVQVFITGVTMWAGLVTLANAVQVAFIPFLDVLVVSVPPLWWFILAFAASLLTLLLTFSIKQILNPRRVPL
jgi:predicted anti-sigma-YlaC factor YlaD